MGNHPDREHFIPYRKAEIVQILCSEGTLNTEEQQKFRCFCKVLESIYHFEFHEKVETLKDSYFP